MYADMMNGYTRILHILPLEVENSTQINIFMWFLKYKVLLTKDNLTKKKWQGCKKCYFCDSNETIEHLFIYCPFAHIV
jgi:hypothetical protein